MSESAATPEPSPFEKFRALAKRIVSVSKREADAEEKKPTAPKKPATPH